MVNTASAGLIGVVLLVRHGDRSDVVFQNYTTYDSVQGSLTPYGAVCLTFLILCSANILTEPRV